MSSVTGIDVTQLFAAFVCFFSRALTLQNENWAKSGLRRECFNAFRLLRIIFKSVQLTGTNFHFQVFKRCISFLYHNWGARRLAVRLAEDVVVFCTTPHRSFLSFLYLWTSLLVSCMYDKSDNVSVVCWPIRKTEILKPDYGPGNWGEKWRPSYWPLQKIP